MFLASFSLCTQHDEEQPALMAHLPNATSLHSLHSPPFHSVFLLPPYSRRSQHQGLNRSIHCASSLGNQTLVQNRPFFKVQYACLLLVYSSVTRLNKATVSILCLRKHFWLQPKGSSRASEPTAPPPGSLQAMLPISGMVTKQIAQDTDYNTQKCLQLYPRAILFKPKVGIESLTSRGNGGIVGGKIHFPTQPQRNNSTSWSISQVFVFSSSLLLFFSSSLPFSSLLFPSLLLSPLLSSLSSSLLFSPLLSSSLLLSLHHFAFA